MDNLLSPAYPSHLLLDDKQNAYVSSCDMGMAGFTKLELAALMIAAALIGKYNLKTPEDQTIIAQLANELAKAVLEEANK